MFPRLIHGHKVRLVVPQVHRGVRIFDGETKRAREFCECHNIPRVVEELRKLTLEIVVARNEIEDAFFSFPYRTRPGEWLAGRKHPCRFEKLWRLLLDG